MKNKLGPSVTIKKLLKVCAFALLFLLGVSIPLTAATDSFTGAIFTTWPDGTTVNGNIYDQGRDVYLNGGPQNRQFSGLPDGLYFFQVTDPSGATLLSTDSATCRQLQVLNGRVAGAVGPCPHPNGAYNPANGSLPVQLWPFSPTPNAGSEYKAWLVRADHALVDPNDARILHFASQDSKTDNFKCRTYDPQLSAPASTLPALTISCPLSFTVTNDLGQCRATVLYADPIVSGGVGSITVTGNPVSGSLLPVGTTTVTCVAKDQAGTTASCSFDITVVDIEAPTIARPSDMLVCNDQGQCSAVVSFNAPAATDNCTGGLTATCNPASGSGFAVGATIVTCSAIDMAGNVGVCTFNVTVKDCEAPKVTCPPDATIEFPGDTSPRATGYAKATDNCNASINYSESEKAGDNPVVNKIKKIITRTWTATDGAGLTATCTQTITVKDTTPPVLSGCPTDNPTVQCLGGVPPAPSVTANDGGDGSIQVQFTQTESIPGSSCHNTMTRTWTATDSCGNIASCAQIITINDTTAPVLSGCPALTSTYQCLGDVQTPATVTAMDNCDGSVLVSFTETQSNPGSSCNNLITRTWTARDRCGNTASCKQSITVNDTISPAITQCVPDRTVQCASEVPPPSDAAVVALDNCGGPVTITHDGDVIIPGGCPNRFTVKRTYHATDLCRNHSECTQTITVNDTTPPAISCPQSITVNHDAGASAAVVSLNVTANDNCDAKPTVICAIPNGLSAPLQISSPYSFPVGTTTVTCQAVDVCGNISGPCSFPVTVLTSIRGKKFYDANGNGVLEVGEPGIGGWKIRLLDSQGLELASQFTQPDGSYCFNGLTSGKTYIVREALPLETNWRATTPTNYTFGTLNAPATSNFGHVCLGAGGGLTLGFWSNKNGQSVMATFGGGMTANLAFLTSLNLRNASGAAFDPTSYTGFRNWLLSANATNMAYMLSAQLTAMELNVRCPSSFGGVKGASWIYAPGTTSANIAGFATVNAIMMEANNLLGSNAMIRDDGSLLRALAAALKDALDRGNNNLNFVQPGPCSFTF